ncbi:hypothetical protein ACU4GA_00425 [Methylobacterium oryzae CBMB20]
MARLSLAFLVLALAGAAPASAFEVLTGTLRRVAERGEIVLGYRESSVPFSFVEGRHPDGSPGRSATPSTSAARSPTTSRRRSAGR